MIRALIVAAALVAPQIAMAATDTAVEPSCVVILPRAMQPPSRASMEDDVAGVLVYDYPKKSNVMMTECEVQQPTARLPTEAPFVPETGRKKL